MEGLAVEAGKFVDKKDVFYIYDERMLQHKEWTPIVREGTDKPHVIPEIPERISCIHDHLRDQG